MLDLPWGLLVLFPIVLLAYMGKLDRIIDSYGISRNAFLWFIAVLLFAGFFTVNFGVMNTKIYMNIGGFILPLAALVWLVIIPVYKSRANIFLTALIICILYMIVNGMDFLAGMPFFEALAIALPLIVGVVAAMGSGKFSGAIAAVLGGSLLAELLYYLLLSGMDAAPVWELGGVRMLNNIILSAFVSQLIIKIFRRSEVWQTKGQLD